MRPGERSFKRNSQYAKALNEVVKAGDALTDALTEKQKEMFEDYLNAQREFHVLTDCETFIYSFHLAAKIMIDVLTEGTTRNINQAKTMARQRYAAAPLFSKPQSNFCP